MPTIVTYEPRNAETPERALQAPLTSADDFYVRSHFAAPHTEAAAWRLKLEGGVVATHDITTASLRAHPARKGLIVMLECAGNGRTRFRPLPGGVPWGEGALACGRFAGVPLRELIRVPDDARELVFTGADIGNAADGKRQPFARSLPIDIALDPDTLLCDEMDGAPLTRDHGAPVRLLVPSYYGMASVKWLDSIRATHEPFRGYFQETDYQYERRDGSREPITRMLVKSMLVGAPATARVGESARLTGWAWSGHAPIARVDVSMDGGKSWNPANLDAPAGKYAWRGFHHDWTPEKTGVHLVLTRARDEAGHEQPWETPWNARGYGMNAMLPHRILVQP